MDNVALAVALPEKKVDGDRTIITNKAMWLMFWSTRRNRHYEFKMRCCTWLYTRLKSLLTLM